MRSAPAGSGDAVDEAHAAAEPTVSARTAMEAWGAPLGALRSSRTWRALSRVLAILVVSGSLFYLVRTFQREFADLQVADLDPRPWPLLASLLLTLVCVLLGGLIWQRVLRGLGVSLGLRRCMSTHLLANLGGYVPGYAWKHLGKAYMTRRLGVPGGQASAAVLAEFVGLALSRAAVSAATLSGTWLAAHGVPVASHALWALRALSWGALFLFPWFVAAVAQHARRRRTTMWGDLRVHKTELAIALALMCVTWTLYGAGFAALLDAIHPIGPDQYAASVFAASTSFLVSLIVFFVPAGLTVREGVIAFTLSGVVPGGVAALSAVLSRVVLVVGESVGALVGAWLRRSYVDNPKG